MESQRLGLEELRTPDDVVNYVFPDEDDRRRPYLMPLIDSRAGRSPAASRDDIEAMPEPKTMAPGVRFDYSYEELRKIGEQFLPPGEEAFQRLVRYAMVWSGVRVGDEMLHWTSTDHGYKPGSRLPRVTLPVDRKRLSMRVVPDLWGDKFGTAFRLRRDRGASPQLSIVEEDGSMLQIARPTSHYTTESVQTMAYAVENGPHKNVTVNPLQRCPQACKFCCRGYHDMTPDRRKELINLSPEEMARALMVKFPGINWGDVSGITLVTGDFKSEERVLEYLGHMVSAMGKVTNGKWDSSKNSGQDITVSTHLLRTREAMENARRLGMRRFIHTVETVGHREELMHLGGGPVSNSRNKGHSSFDDSLKVLHQAIEVFGPDNVEPVMVIGLDPIEKTKFAMDALKGIGVTHVSRAMVNVYHDNQFGLLTVPFEDVVAGMQYAREQFSSPYRRKVGDFRNSNELAK